MVRPLACCVSLLAFSFTARAQTPAKQPERALAPADQPERAPTLHDAWLFEVLDLDIGKAVAAYEKVAADQRPGNLDRWVAVARLAELKRLGVEVNLRFDLKEVPEPLRAPLASIAAPLPVADLLQRVDGDPVAVLQRIGMEDGRLPPLHPVTLRAEEWRLAQNPRVRELRREQNNRARAGSNRNSDWVNQANAADIVRAELGGSQSGAAARRDIWFANWKPPKLPGDPQPWLEKFRNNLEAWLRDSEQSSVGSLAARQQRDLLTQLRDTVNDKAATDPAAALALVARLPLYAERLLGLPAPASR